MNLHAIRRNNLALLLREFSQARIAAGEPTNGTEKAFAAQLQISKSLLSQLKTSRPISDANAAQIESLCKKKPGYLSEARPFEEGGGVAGEVTFLAVARSAYRKSNRADRIRLKQLVADFANRQPNDSAG